MSERPELPRIKVCGVRSVSDVAGALALGLDAVGLVAWPGSPRHIAPAHAAALVRALPSAVLPVAVFVDVQPAEARAWLATSGARALQLCGAERPEDWIDFPALVLRRVAVDTRAFDELVAWNGIAHGFVLDHPSSAGGSGRAVDRALALDLARAAPCLLAGGLAADNVGELARAVRPHGVDASSRLESAPGKKDPALVTAFVAAARGVMDELIREEIPR